MSTPVVNLTKGTRALNINDQSKYFLGLDFVPPPVSIEPNFSQGSSANRFGGASLISTRAVNRSLSFSVNVRAASYNEMSRAVRDIQYMLSLAGDPEEPVLLKYKSNSDVTFEPLWGQDGWLCYQIEYGTASVGGEYGTTNRRATNVNVRLDLIVRPYALGLRQRLASATGGVLEDTIGTVDGKSRGTIIPEATTNKITNPIFGHSTYSNDWTAANLNTARNTDKEFVLLGDSSAKLVPTGAGTPLYTQSITAGATTHTLSAYVKQVNGGTIDSSVAQLHFNDSTVTPDAYESIGNGWYRMRYTATAGAGAANYGVRPISPYGIYLDGVQLEEKGYTTSLACGDFLGNAWTGTAHDSTSSRTAARVRAYIADALNFMQFTIRVVWKPDKANTAFTAASPRMFETDTVTFRGFFDFSSDIWTFSDGTNTITSSADTFAAQERIILHFVGSPGSLKIYKNGSEIATGSTYTPPTPPTYLYIGTSNAAAAHAGGTFMDFTTFDRALTATQVTADYANIAQLVADNQRVGTIPWLWTKDGDDVVDNHNDSDADNFAVVSGIPGSDTAETIFHLGMGGTGIDTGKNLWLSNLTHDIFFNPGELYYDASGSTDGDSSGSAYQAKTIATASQVWSASPLEVATLKALAGKEIFALARMGDDASTIGIQIAFQYSLTGTNIRTDFKTITAPSAYRLLSTLPISVRDFRFVFGEGASVDQTDTTGNWGVVAQRTSGTGCTRLDYFQIMPRPVVNISATSNSTNGTFLVKGRRVEFYDPDDDHIEIPSISLTGDTIELEPNKYNHLITLFGGLTVAPDVVLTVTHKIYIIPRWSLL